MQSNQRLHSMDNLRALAMLAGVFFHAALAYSPIAQPFFPTADRSNSAWVDLPIWFLHLFRMPLFFVVAGFFTALQVQRKGIGGMLRSRWVRVGIPFLVFLPIVHMAISADTLHAARTVAHPSPLLGFIRDLLAMGPLPSMPPGSGHLWFLYYLLLFCVLAWVARALGLGGLMARLAAVPPRWLLIGMPLLVLPSLAAMPVPHPAPESLLPQFWAIGNFGTFFLLGAVIQQHPLLIERMQRHAVWLLAASLVLYATFMWILDGSGRVATLSAGHLFLAILEATISVWMTVVCVALGRMFLERSSRVMRYLAGASYWIYLAHLPVLLAIQYRLMDLPWHWSAKLALSIVATLALCVLAFELLVQRTVLRRLVGTSRHDNSPEGLVGFAPP